MNGTADTLQQRIRGHLPRARAEQQDGGPWEALARLCDVSVDEALRAAGGMLGLTAFGPEALSRLRLDRSVELAAMVRARAFIGSDETGATQVIVVDPWDDAVQRWLRTAKGGIRPTGIATVQSIAAALEVAGRTGKVELPSEAGAQLTDDDALHSIDLHSVSAEGHPVVQFVDATVLEAWDAGASDIHFEVTRSGLAVRMRIDGVLTDTPRRLAPTLATQVISRLKVMAELDISEQRVPQDGRVRLKVSGRAIDFRVSVIPSAFGEDVVLRVLDKRQLASATGRLSLAALGFAPHAQDLVRELAERAHGMLLVTGPTGSGKTTTLYSVLSEIANRNEKIVTIEDPIEYEIEGVLQIPVNEKKGLTFARGLRSVLRHDPDLIMVGEIRDEETADIAVQAALTGHLVFATVHANSVFDVLGRFVHMHVDIYSFMSALNGVVSQRLVRRLCPQCRRARELTPTETRRVRSLGVSSMPGMTHEPVGCSACRDTGFRGRAALAEVVVLDDEFRDLAIRRAPLSEMRRHLTERGLMTLATAGMALVERGETSFQEVWRAVATG